MVAVIIPEKNSGHVLETATVTFAIVCHITTPASNSSSGTHNIALHFSRWLWNKLFKLYILHSTSLSTNQPTRFRYHTHLFSWAETRNKLKSYFTSCHVIRKWIFWGDGATHSYKQRTARNFHTLNRTNWTLYYATWSSPSWRSCLLLRFLGKLPYRV